MSAVQRLPGHVRSPRSDTSSMRLIETSPMSSGRKVFSRLDIPSTSACAAVSTPQPIRAGALSEDELRASPALGAASTNVRNRVSDPLLQIGQRMHHPFSRNCRSACHLRRRRPHRDRRALAGICRHHPCARTQQCTCIIRATGCCMRVTVLKEQGAFVRFGNRSKRGYIYLAECWLLVAIVRS